MILTFAASAALQLMSVGNMPESWGYLLPIPVLLFGLLTAFGLAAPVPRRDSGAEPRVADEVYAAVVYFTALLAVFMAPFNHSRQFGLQAVGLYALVLGVVLGALAVLIWRGKTWAMIAAFALSLAHWIALANINPWLWSSPPYLAAPVVSGILTVVCISFAAKARRRRAAVANSPVPVSE
jgi:peptidoglycan/LPS O-acetylase OafA/YrhL